MLMLKFMAFVRKNAFKHKIFPHLPEIELKITTRDSWIFDGLALGDETIIGRLGCYCPQYIIVKDGRSRQNMKFKHGAGNIIISNYGKETSYHIACLMLHEMLHQFIAETYTTMWMKQVKYQITNKLNDEEWQVYCHKDKFKKLADQLRLHKYACIMNCSNGAIAKDDYTYYNAMMDAANSMIKDNDVNVEILEDYSKDKNEEVALLPSNELDSIDEEDEFSIEDFADNIEEKTPSISCKVVGANTVAIPVI